MMQPSLIGRERHQQHQQQDAVGYVTESDEDECGMMWRAPPLLTLADVPWLIDDTVEPGVALR